MNENLLNSLREYRDNIQAKYSFYNENQFDIVGSNSLLPVGNTFAMSNATDFGGKVSKLDSNIELSIQTHKQRIKSVKKSVNRYKIPFFS